MQPSPSLRSVGFSFSLLGHHMFSAASPLAPRATFNCTDPAATYDDLCWTELGMVDFLSDRAAEWGPNRRLCDSDDDNCCQPDEAWSTCMLRTVFGGNQDCTQIDARKCIMQVEHNQNLPFALRPKYRYAVYTIFG